MRRRWTAILLIVVAGGLTASAALASNVHFKSHDGPTFTDKGLFLEATGSITGLGNGDVVITLSATGQPVASCTNPSGQNQPPGQNPAEATVSGASEIPAGQIKNGNLTFTVDTAGPVTPIPGAPDCPGSKWTEDITDMIFAGHTATITIYQGIGCAVDSGTGQPNANCVQVFQQNYTV